MITEQHFAHFKTFGFVVVKGLLSDAEVTTVRAEFDAAFDDVQVPFDGSTRQWMPLMGDATPTLARLLEDSRFYDTAQRFTGQTELVPFMVDGNKYVGDTGWHPDTYGARGIKFIMYLEPVGRDSGALRVVPGSHREPLHSAIKEYAAAHRLSEVDDLPAADAASEPGDVVIFDIYAWHASKGGAAGRPMCTVSYFVEPDTDEQAELFRTHCGGAQGLLSSFGIEHARPHWHGWFDNPEDSPRRRELIERAERWELLEAWGVRPAAAERV